MKEKTKHIWLGILPKRRGNVPNATNEDTFIYQDIFRDFKLTSFPDSLFYHPQVRDAALNMGGFH